MPDYRRSQIKGGTYFITIVTCNRAPLFLQPDARRLLHDAWVDVTKRFPFTTDAVCMLPDHIHFLMTLPESDSDFSIRIREITRLFTKSFLPLSHMPDKRTASRINKKEAQIWQRRFWEHTIRNEYDLHQHLDYIHYNPVKHGLVKNVADWEWSSFHRYVRLNLYDANWGTDVERTNRNQSFGE